MDRLLQCECGFKARGGDEDGLVAQVLRQWDAPGMALPHDKALLLALRGEVDAGARSKIALISDTRTEEEQL